MSVGDDNDVQLEAQKAWLARAVAAPNAWRQRGATAGGLLSAAAAAALAGLYTGVLPSDTSNLATLLIVAASVSFVAAVACLLIGSVWPAPEQTKDTQDFAEAVQDYCKAESIPVKKWVIAGAVFGVAAILATAGGALAVTFDDPRRDALVSVTDEAHLALLQEVCPDADALTAGRVAQGNAEFVELFFTAETCGTNEPVSVTLPRSALVVFLFGDS